MMLENARILLAAKLTGRTRADVEKLVKQGQKSKRGGRRGPSINWRSGGVGIGACKEMRTDPQIAFCMAIKKAPIARAKWEVQCDDARTRDLVESNLKRIWRRMTLRSLNALEFGFQAFEKVWDLVDGAFVIRKLVDLDPSDVTMLAEPDGSFGGLEIGGDAGGRNGVTILREKVFVYTHQKEFGNLYGRSEFANIVDYWWWSTCLYDITNRYYERKADPGVLGRAPTGVQQSAAEEERDNLQHMEELLETVKSGGIVVLPSDAVDEQGNPAWDAKYLMDDQRGPMFTDYINHLDMKKMRGLLIPERTATQDESTGSYGMAETHRDTFLQTLDLTVAEYEEHVNEYIVRPIVRFNKPGPVECAVKVARLSDDERERLWQVVETILQSGESSTLLHRIDHERLLSATDLPTVTDTHAALEDDEEA